LNAPVEEEAHSGLHPVPPDVEVRVEHLYMSFGANSVLRDVSLDIPRGETTVIMGPSGCGKSVLLKLIIGLLTPDSGHIWIGGLDVPQLSWRQMNRLRRRMGMLFQSAALFDSMTVEENVAFMLRQHTRATSAEIAEAVAEALQMVDMDGTQRLKPAQLSGGMRKRVGLARAIVMRPELVLYDEPTTGLDPITAREINLMIRDLHERLGTTSIVVTHDTESALYVGSRIALTEGGRIVAEGSPEEMRRSDARLARQFFHAELPRRSGAGAQPTRD
jgi:phospholipid/cholesterol/gamma-HCH transport system ATP-binding protein